MESLFGYGTEERLGKENKLVKLKKVLDWGRFEKHLQGIHKNQIEDKGGQRPYDSLKMFKAILLGQWHSLSDPALEESLRVRLDFMLFTGFELGSDLPDETTLCRFRNQLIDRGLDKRLFKELNKQLENLNLKVKNCHGAVVDATIIDSASRPNRHLDANEDTGEYEVKESADKDARWLKKGKKFHFGYRGYVRTDAKDGYIEAVHVKSANKPEVKELEKTVENCNAKRVYADKGFASKSNRNMLKSKGLRDGIMEKATRFKPLTVWQKLKNKLISTQRFIVERTFGTLKRQLRMARSSYRGRRRTEGQLIFKAMCLNMLKAANTLTIN